MEQIELLRIINLGGDYLGVIILILCVITSIINQSRLETPVRKLSYYLMFLLIAKVLFLGLRFSEVSNIQMYKINNVIQFILLSLFYKSIISKPVSIKNIFPIIIGVGTLFLIANSYLLSGMFSFNLSNNILKCVFFISYAVLYFSNTSTIKSKFPKSAKSLSIINLAVLIYFSFSLLSSLLNKFAIIDYAYASYIYGCIKLIYIVFLIMIYISIRKAVRSDS